MQPIITYQTLIDEVKNYITSNCINVSNFNSLPYYYKSFSKDINTVRYGKGNSITAVITISVSNPVSQVTSSVVQTQLTDFLNKCGVVANTYSYNIDGKSILPFLHDLELFCSSKVCFAMSYPIDEYFPKNGAAGVTSLEGNRYSTDNKYTVYNSSNTVPEAQIKKITPINTTDEGWIVKTSDIQNIIDNLISNIKKATNRVYPIKFGMTFKK